LVYLVQYVCLGTLFRVCTYLTRPQLYTHMEVVFDFLGTIVVVVQRNHACRHRLGDNDPIWLLILLLLYYKMVVLCVCVCRGRPYNTSSVTRDYGRKHFNNIIIIRIDIRKCYTEELIVGASYVPQQCPLTKRRYL